MSHIRIPYNDILMHIGGTKGCQVETPLPFSLQNVMSMKLMPNVRKTGPISYTGQLPNRYIRVSTNKKSDGFVWFFTSFQR